MSSTIKCKLCSFEGHMLSKHVVAVHGMSPVEYIEKHGAVMSPLGETTMKKLTREKIVKPMREVFANWKYGFEDDETVSIFSQPTHRTPKLDPHYSFPEQVALEMLSVLDKPQRNNVWIAGPSGSGKTSLVTNLAALHNVNLFTTLAHQRWTPANAFGKWIVKNGETHFRYGIVPKWLREGGWLLINDFSTLDPEMVNSLKTILEFPRYITLTENDDEVIEAADPEDCKLIVSDNTLGRGDDTGQFVNTNVQSVADMRRFNAFIVLDYIGEAQEVAMLTSQFRDLPDKVAEKFVKIANATRHAFKVGDSGRVLSTAEVVNWAENYLIFATAHYSARISFLNGYEPKDATRIRELINNEFGQEDSETLQNTAAAARASDKTGA